MSLDLESWDDYAMMAIHHPTLEALEECNNLLEKICAKHEVSVKDFKTYMKKFRPKHSQGNFLN